MMFEEFTEEMRKERQYQSNKWASGTEDSLDDVDSRNTLSDWVLYIAKFATHAFHGGFDQQNPPITMLATFKRSMVKVATLAYSAYRWADIKAGTTRPVGK